jgi:GntR family transcriptional repressor for pyruvate dehydrogenase complex
MGRRNMNEIKKTSLSDKITAEIINDIERGIYKPGDRMPNIKELGIAFGVSAISVRAALHQLQTMGILDIRQGKGTYIRDRIGTNAITNNIRYLLTRQKQYFLSLIEARRIIECGAVKIAAKRASKHQIGRLHRFVEDMKKNVKRKVNFSIDDLSFHLLIAECSKNPVLIIFIKSIRELLKEEIDTVLGLPRSAERAIGFHEEIYKAIKNRNPEYAGRIMADHLSDIEKAIVKG